MASGPKRSGRAVKSSQQSQDGGNPSKASTRVKPPPSSSLSTAPDEVSPTPRPSELLADDPEPTPTVARSVEKVSTLLYEYGTYCVPLPLENDGWKPAAGEEWEGREQLQDFFEEFRCAIRPRNWDVALETGIPGQLPAELNELYEAMRLSTGEVDLEPLVQQYVCQRFPLVLDLVSSSRRLQRDSDRDGLAPKEADFRKERALNFPRNPGYDLLKRGDAGNFYEKLEHQHSRYHNYLKAGSTYHTRLVPVPLCERKSKAGLDTSEAGQDALECTEVAVAAGYDEKLAFMREHLAMRWDHERGLHASWQTAPKTISGRKRMMPRTGTCDATTFLSLELELAEVAFKNAASKRDVVRRLLHDCSLVRHTVDEARCIARTLDGLTGDQNDEELSVRRPLREKPSHRFCPQLGRTSSPADIDDVLGHAALLSRPPEQRRDLPSVAQSQTSGPIPTTPGPGKPQHARIAVPLLVPLLLYEFKTEAYTHKSQGIYQLRMYLSATCHFLELLGITGFMVYGLLTEGCHVITIGAWREKKEDVEKENVDVQGGPVVRMIPCAEGLRGLAHDQVQTWVVDHRTTSYDMRNPTDAFQLASFVAWVKVVHRARLERLLTRDVLQDYIDRVTSGQLEWTVTHQIPIERRSNQTDEAAA
ncbi:hypothetical protein AURDEDRAFT_125618 [Auricularia subglabra TFB-10046 SS5]|nr:hypothetical protein AURDEDRAFT_125618 [Auricularia subglabra TFB-10046 SS5]